VGLKKAAEAPWQGQQRGYNRVAQHGFGLAVCLAESVLFANDLGADINLQAEDIRLDAVLFGETQSRIVFTTAADQAEVIQQTIGDAIQAQRIGTVTSDGLKIKVNGQTVIQATAEALRTPYEEAIPARMG
jgi:phosphoribosylformylglycinamidine synthase